MSQKNKQDTWYYFGKCETDVIYKIRLFEDSCYVQ